MRVLLLNQAFYPDVVATAQAAKDLADALVRRGHTVTAVASRSIYGKSGAVLPKAERVAVRDGAGAVVGEIDVRRVGASVFGKAGYAARIADFGFFYLLAFLRVMITKRPDVVVSFTTPPFIGLVGIVNRWLRGGRAVYWVMDLYPDLPVACGVMKPRGAATRFFEGVNRFILRHSDVDVVLGRCMRDRVLAKGVPAGRVQLIPIWAETAGMVPMAHEANPFRAALARGGRAAEFVVMYSGNFGIGHDAKTICDAMERLKGERGVQFEFVGGGKRRAEVERFVAERGIDAARWHEYQAREKLGESLSAADVHLISLREGVEGIMVPSKLMGIMAAGRASIFVGHPGSEIARVLTESESGLVVREGDGAGLAAAIMRLKNDEALRRRMGENARRALDGHYDSATACRAWVEMLERLTGNAPGGAAAGEQGVNEPAASGSL